MKFSYYVLPHIFVATASSRPVRLFSFSDMCQSRVTAMQFCTGDIVVYTYCAFSAVSYVSRSCYCEEVYARLDTELLYTVAAICRLWSA